MKHSYVAEYPATLSTNDDLEAILEQEDNAVKAGKGIGGLSLVDDDEVVIL